MNGTTDTAGPGVYWAAGAPVDRPPIRLNARRRSAGSG